MSGFLSEAAQERTCAHVGVGPILLQKPPQQFREITIRNNRIDAGEYLNQCCVSAPQLESILRARMDKIFCNNIGQQQT
jgi:hypothetical protein